MSNIKKKRLLKYNETIIHSVDIMGQYLKTDEDILNDPNWLPIVEQAKKIINMWDVTRQNHKNNLLLIGLNNLKKRENEDKAQD